MDPSPALPATPAVPDEADAIETLFALAYEELRRSARRHLRREADGHTLCTTALVHEVYLRLAAGEGACWRDREHFLAIASRIMRRVLIDHARRHLTTRRGGGARPLPLEDAVIAVEEQAQTLIELDAALTRLGALDQRLARVVECRFFAGMNDEETARVLGVTPRTVWRDWAKARGWLYHELYG
jgi:RNA polymerase sigma factor (TIGR02999 family)